MTINVSGNEDAWQRQCLIEVTSDSSHIIRLHSMTETVDIDMGERDLDKIDLLNLGQIPKHGAIGITTVTFEGYPQEAATETNSTGDGFFDIFASAPLVSGQEHDEDMSNTLTRYRVAILWVDEALDDASDITATSVKMMRFVMADCFCTSCKTTFTDGVLKQTLVFKGVCFKKTGSTNIKMESNDSSASGGVPALGNYTAGADPGWA